MVNTNNTKLREYRLSILNTNFSEKFNTLKENSLFLIKCINDNPNFSAKEKLNKIVEYARTYSTKRKELIDKYIRLVINV